LRLLKTQKYFESSALLGYIFLDDEIDEESGVFTIGDVT